VISGSRKLPGCCAPFFLERVVLGTSNFRSERNLSATPGCLIARQGTTTPKTFAARYMILLDVWTYEWAVVFYSFGPGARWVSLDVGKDVS